MKKNFYKAPNGVLTYTYVHTYTWKGVKSAIWVADWWIYEYLCTTIRALQGFFGSEVILRCT